MKPTDFSKYLTDHLTRYLSHERGCSSNTIIAYRDTFVLFITFMHQVRKIKAEKLFIKSITKASVVEFLDWLQSERKCSDTTRNLRLAALHSFFKYVQYKNPDNLYDYQDIMSIKVKKARKKDPKFIPEKISCHSIRSSKAMHLLQAGVNLVYISYPYFHKIRTLQANSLKVSSIR